jgi:hypothetical protein
MFFQINKQYKKSNDAESKLSDSETAIALAHLVLIFWYKITGTGTTLQSLLKKIL